MTDYIKQAEDFLKECNATIKMVLVGCMPNDAWKDTNPRNRYFVTIETPKGKMNLDFWDSLYNTEKYQMTIDDHARKMYGRYYDGLNNPEKMTVRDMTKKTREEASPKAYDILACLEKYDAGTFKDFCWEFGYDDDSITAFKIYTACQEQYSDLCRIFTPEQMDKLREIQ